MAARRTPVDLLMARLAEVETEVAPQLAEMEDLRQAIRTLTGQPGAQATGGNTKPEARRVSVMPVLEAILNEQPDREFHASELVRMLEERGIPMKQANPDNTVATAMARLAEKGVASKLGGNRFKRQDSLSEALMRAVRAVS
jgi:hypothetical protein